MTYRKLLLQILICLSCNLLLFYPSFSNGEDKTPCYFSVTVLETSDSTLSDIFRQAYEKRFFSKNLSSNLTEMKEYDSNSVEFTNHFIHPEIEWCKWKKMDLETQDELFESNLTLGDKSLIIYTRMKSWRGNIYVGFLVSQKIKQDFLDSFKKGNSFRFDLETFPRWSDNFSWERNNIFRYQNGLYYIHGLGSFEGAKGIRNLYKINEDGEVTPIATFKISSSINEIIETKKFSAYSSLWHTAYNIAGGTWFVRDNGTLKPYGSRWEGHYAAARAIVRPWIVNNDSFPVLPLKFLEDWSLRDIWNLREYQTLFEHIPAAEYELAVLYQNSFGINEKDSQQLAKANVKHVINTFLESISSSYFEYRDNDFWEFRKQVAKGTYSGPLEKRKYNKKIANTCYWDQEEPEGVDLLATLAIDNIDYLKQILKIHKYSDLKNSFNKSLLMYAVHMNHFDTVKYLVESSADVNDVTGPNEKCDYPDLPKNLKRSALTYAVENSSIEIISFLLDNGAKENLIGEPLAPFLLRNPRFLGDEKKMPVRELVKKYKLSNILFKPSFDCKKARTPLEKIICSSKTLSIYDRELGSAYERLQKVSSYPEFDKLDQITWVKRRNHQCGDLKRPELILHLSQLIRSRTRYLHNRLKYLE